MILVIIIKEINQRKKNQTIKQKTYSISNC